MFLHELAHQLYKKFIPTDEVRAMQLHNQATSNFAATLTESKEIELHKEGVVAYNESEKEKEGFQPKKLRVLNWKHKITLYSQRVDMQYIVGGLFGILVPVIQRFMNGGSGDDQPSADDIRRQFLEEELERLKR